MRYGLDLKREKLEQSDDDWVFGSNSSVCIAAIPERERQNYLPIGEVQRGKEDTMDCASRAPVNILEAKFNFLIENDLLSKDNYEWLKQNSYFQNNKITFSDRFVAINSGTTRNGNSLKAPLEAIRKQGLIPKTLFPLLPRMTWDEYHDKSLITDYMVELGLEFTKRFTINYERVYEQYFGNLLIEDMLDVAGYAWPQPVNGVYPKIKRQPNHAFVIFSNAFYAFDNYLDVDNDFIKHLARDFDFLDYGYRVYITSEQAPRKKKCFLTRFI